LYETALKFMGIGIGGVMYTAGKKGGARGAQLIHNRIGLEGDDLLQAALVAFNQSNWGCARLLRDNGSVSVEVLNSALASSLPPQKKNVCQPLAGYIAGFLEEAWKRSVKVREIECSGKGDRRCLFVVE
jgi:predicted hydrocarbon binding protein